MALALSLLPTYITVFLGKPGEDNLALLLLFAWNKVDEVSRSERGRAEALQKNPQKKPLLVNMKTTATQKSCCHHI